MSQATVAAALLLLLSAASAGGHHHLLTLDEACRVTPHRSICLHSLSSHSRPPSARRSRRWWATTALSFAAADVRRAACHLPPNSRRTVALADCAECLADAEQQLRGSHDELRRLEQKTFELQMGDVLTWVSAALTDENTCLDGLAEDGGGGERVAAEVRRQVSNTTCYTSNALALVNGLASAGGRD